MPDPQTQALADQVALLQKQLKEIEPNMWFVTSLRGLVSLFAVALAGVLISFVYAWSAINVEVKHHGDQVAALEKAVEDARKEQVRSAEEGRKDNARLVELILDRFPRKSFGALVYDGEVVRAAGNKLVLFDDATKQEVSVTPADDTEVTVKGRKAKLADLKPGMRVRVVTNDGLVLRITSPPD